MAELPRNPFKSLLIRLLRPAIRFSIREGLEDEILPGLYGLLRRQVAVEKAIRRHAPQVWRGGLAGGLYPGSPADEDLRYKYFAELRYWVTLNAVPGFDPNVDGEMHDVFGKWQAARLRSLGRDLGMSSDAELANWARGVRAVEFGGGPHPLVAEAAWRSAVSIDPLADGYEAERLLPPNRRGFVQIAAVAEDVPLPSGAADLVICHNALDHVDRPRSVLREAARLLAPGGMLWLIVDLRSTVDHMHPHVFDEQGLRTLIRACGFHTFREEVDNERASSGDAAGEYRGLFTLATPEGTRIPSQVEAMPTVHLLNGSPP